MNQRARSADLDAYLAELRRELADLPPDEVDAVLEDVTPQLLDLDPDGRAELGTPGRYAAELRAAAGYGRPVTGSPWVARLSLVVLLVGTATAAYGGFLSNRVLSTDARYSMPVIALVLLASVWPLRHHGPSVRGVATLPEARAIRGLLPGRDHVVVRYLASLLPGWFAVHGLLVGFGGYLIAERAGWASGAPVLFGVVLGGLVVALGQRSLRDRRFLWVSLPSSAFALGVVVHLANLVQLVNLLPGTP